MDYAFMLKTIKNASIDEKKILYRVGYDFTLQEQDGAWVVPNDMRIRATIPTIEYLLAHHCSIIFMSYLCRPDPGSTDPRFKMDAVARYVAKLINRPVKKLNATVGPEVEQSILKMKPGELIMLENTRLNQGEITADPKLGGQMARLGDFVIFDAFAQAMRVHASTTALLKLRKDACAVGLLMERELETLQGLTRDPKQPFVLALGGAKVSDKSGLMYNVIDKAENILIGGALANPFLKASGFTVGGSLIESVFVDQAKGEGEPFDALQVARDLLAGSGGDRIQLPRDVVVARIKEDGGFDERAVRIEECGDNKKLCDQNEGIVDIGPKTRKMFSAVLQQAKTIFWNGPMGVFETQAFAEGTRVVAEAVATSPAFTVAGGGDTEGVIARYNLEEKLDHISTGGGAALNLLAGQALPVMEYLEG